MSYSLWMGEAHTPLACVAHVLAQWHTRERMSSLMHRLCTPTQLRAKYQDGAYEQVLSILTNREEVQELDHAMRAAVRHGPLAQAAAHEAERERQVRAFLAAIHRREYVAYINTVWKCISYCSAQRGRMCRHTAHLHRPAALPTIPTASRSARPHGRSVGKDFLRHSHGLR